MFAKFSMLKNLFQKTVAWGKEVATGNDGMGSTSRVVVLLVSTTVVGVLIAHVAMNHGLPMADQMYGLSALLAAGSGAYASNKIRGFDPNHKDDDHKDDKDQGGDHGISTS